jgi:trehalose/maltose hydrolase-like predicted phosphorylase
MHEVLEPTQDPGWVLRHEGYNVLTESGVESRFALGNGFVGMRAARSVSRGPTWVGWLGFLKWASWPRCYVAGLFDRFCQVSGQVAHRTGIWLPLAVSCGGDEVPQRGHALDVEGPPTGE